MAKRSVKKRKQTSHPAILIAGSPLLIRRDKQRGRIWLTWTVWIQLFFSRIKLKALCAIKAKAIKAKAIKAHPDYSGFVIKVASMPSFYHFIVRRTFIAPKEHLSFCYLWKGRISTIDWKYWLFLPWLWTILVISFFLKWYGWDWWAG